MKSKITTAQQAHAMKLYALLKQRQEAIAKNKKIKPYKLSRLAKLLSLKPGSLKNALGQLRSDKHAVRCEGSGERGNPCYWLDEPTQAEQDHRYKMHNVDGLT